MEGVTFAYEPWAQFAREAGPLWVEHWKEVALNQDEIALDVDHQQYETQEAAGALRIVVARHQGRIIGYWLGFVRPHFHYRTSLSAYTDIYYVDPAYRQGGVGRDLIRFVDRSLKQQGVQKVFTATKVHLDHSALFESEGYARTEYLFTKLL
jgi:GNAT superfamily N-acetyltransferase